MKIFGENLFQTRLSLAKKGTVETLCMVLVPLMVLLAAGSCEKPETPNEGNNALGYPIDVSFAEYS
ncbi:MAG: hypothetical protein FWH36_05860, partial [Lentimicrobiaceae bacterium]|nr:hypothetical protein [Lentimicrobiaceae bacterium]